VNRATKRLLAKQQQQADKEKAKRQQQTRMPVEREPLRTRLPRFVREARQELKKVAWPSRGEVFTYTVVVLISVTFVTLIVFALDFGFGKAVFKVYGG
jgi:preprotein translocase subunit SecE